MKKFNKIIAVVLCLCFVVQLFVGCKTKDETKTINFEFKNEVNGKISYEYSGKEVPYSLVYKSGLDGISPDSVTYSITFLSSSNTPLDGQPINAGNYKVKAEITSEGYKGSHQAEIEIAKKTLFMYAVPEEWSVDYGDETFEFAYGFSNDGVDVDVITKYENANYSSTEKPTLPGQYKASFTVVDDNHQGSCEASYTIEGRVGRVKVSGVKYDYDGSAKYVVVDLDSSFGTPYQTIESIVYKNSAGQEVSAPTDAGIYSVTITLITDGKVEVINETMTINQKKMQLVAQDITIKRESAINHDVKYNGEAYSDYSITYTTLSGEPVVGTPDAVGTYKVFYSVNDPNLDGETDVLLTIKARVGEISLSGLNAAYNGSAHGVTINGLKDYHVVLAELYSSDNDTFSATKPIEAGNYYVKVIVKTDDVEESPITGILRIAKLGLTISATDISVEKDVDYSAELADYAVSGGYTGSVLVIFYDNSGNELPGAPSEIGNYRVKYMLDNQNYSSELTINLTISARLNKVKISNTTHTYNGDEKCISLDNFAAYHSLISIEYFYNEISATPIDSGMYDVIVTLTADGVEEVLTGTLIINKAIISFSLDNQSIQISEEIVHVTTPAIETLPNYEVWYTNVVGVPVKTKTIPTVDGEYTVELVLVDRNYGGEATAYYYFSARLGEEVVFGNLTQTYGAVVDVTYTLLPFQEFDSLTYLSASYTESSIVPQNAGVYTVTLKIYTDGVLETVTRTLRIHKSTVTFDASDIIINVGTDYEVEYTYTAVNDEEPALITVLYEGINGTSYSSASRPTAYGTYKVTITVVDENLEGSKVINLTLNARLGNITVSGLTGKIYSGSNQIASISLPAYSIEQSITYKDASDNIFDENGPINAGTYTLTIVALTDGVEETVIKTFVIGRKNLQLVAQNIEVFVGDEITHAVTSADIATLPAHSITYKIDAGDSGSLTAPTGRGTYIVDYLVTDDNYIGAASATLLIKARTGRLSIEGRTQAYDGQPKEVTIVGLQDYHGNVQVIYTDLSDGPIVGAPIDAGSYRVYLTATADGEEDVYSVVTMTIQKRSVQLSSTSGSYYVGDTYEIDYAPKSYNGTEFNVEITYTKDGGTSSAIAPTEAGNYEVKITINDANLSGTVYSSLTIYPLIGSFKLSGLNSIYGGINRVVAVEELTAEQTVDSITYEGTGATNYELSSTAPINVGSYKVTITVSTNGVPATMIANQFINKARVMLSAQYTANYNGTYDTAGNIAAAPTPITSIPINGLPASNFTLTFSVAPANPGTYDFTAVGGDNIIMENNSSVLRIALPNALTAFFYGQYYFNEVAQDLTTIYQGVAVASAAKDQYTYTERFKSSNPSSQTPFYFRTANYAEKTVIIVTVDTRFALQMYMENGSYKHRSMTKSDNIKAPIAGENNFKIADGTLTGYVEVNPFTGNYNTSDAAGYKTAWGVLHNRLTGYKVQASTISSGTDSLSFNGTNYTFTFNFNSGAHEEYQNQIKKFSGQDYKGFTSLKVVYVCDIFGRIIKMEITDVYKMTILSVQTSSVGVERIEYGTTGKVVLTNMSRAERAIINWQ